MRFETPLLRGTLMQRYKRFLADARLDDGGVVTATCPNTGSMAGLTAPGSTVYLSRSDSATRKYPHTWEMVETDLGRGRVLVGINTSLPNRLVAEAIEAGRMPELAGYASRRAEVRYGQNSRIDILLEGPGRPPCYVEIKNVHMSRTVGLAEFPDCVTARGAKHLDELARMVESGARSVMLFLVQRADTASFRLARAIDPGYAVAFDAARRAGVEMLCYACDVAPEAITVARALPIMEPPPDRSTRAGKNKAAVARREVSS